MNQSDHNLTFRRWMEDLNRVAKTEFGFTVGSHSERATRPGSMDESDWWLFFVDGMTPRQALIEDLQNC